MTISKKECLKQIAEAFLLEIAKLSKSVHSVRTRIHQFVGSLFLKNEDVTRIESRFKVLKELFQSSISKDVFGQKNTDEVGKSRIKENRFVNLDVKLDEDVTTNINRIKSHIDSIAEEECREILTNFVEQVQVFIENSKNNNVYRNNKQALTVHTFSDNWVFTFLAKLVQKAREALGMKTSSEKLVEDAVESASHVTKP